MIDYLKKIDSSFLLMVLLAMALPFRIPVTVSGEKANLLIPLYITVCLLLLVALVKVIKTGRLFEIRGLDLFLIALFIMVALSLINTRDKREGLIEFAMFYAPFLSMYLAVRIIDPGKKAVKGAVLVLFLQGFLFSSIGVYQYLSGRIFWNPRLIEANEIAPIFRVNSIFWDPNMFARFLTIVVIFSLAYLLFRPGTFNSNLLALVSLTSWVGIMFSYSRSGLLTLIFAMVLLLALGLEGKKISISPPQKKILLSIVVLIVCLVISLELVLPDNIGLRSAFFGRIKLISGGLEVFMAHPLFGAGVGSYKLEMKSQPTFRTSRAVASHNSSMTMLSELGITGFILFLLVILFASRLIKRGKMISIAFFAALMVLVIHSQFYGAFFEDPYTWWILAMLGVTGVRDIC